MKKFGLLVACVLMLGLVGCAHTPGGVAPSNIPIGNRSYTTLRKVRTTDSCVYLFGILPLSGSNSLDKTLQEAVRRGGGDALINITSESVSKFWILFTKQTIIVTGTAIKFQD